jgi:hypothetical protein
MIDLEEGGQMYEYEPGGGGDGYELILYWEVTRNDRSGAGSQIS